MKKIIALVILIAGWQFSDAQKVDSIYFHLYTDSVKKGTHNYINVDGKMSDGSWRPLTSKEIDFSTTYGNFEGNELVLPDNPAEKYMTITAVLKSNPAIRKQVTIWIKQRPDNERLKTDDEILNEIRGSGKKKKKRN